MRRLLSLAVFPLLFCGCFSIAPKADALAKAEIKTEIKAELKSEIKTELKAEIHTDILTSLEVTGAKIDSKMTALETTLKTDVTQTIDQKIAKISGDNNVGPFSGGAIYMLAVCVVIIVGLFFFLAYALRQSTQWKTAFRGLSQSVEDLESTDQTNAKVVKRSFVSKMKVFGLKTMVDKELSKLGVLKK